MCNDEVGMINISEYDKTFIVEVRKLIRRIKKGTLVLKNYEVSDDGTDYYLAFSFHMKDKRKLASTFKNSREKK